jgi:hypothetical protein
MGPTGCPETSITNYKSTLRKIQEECRSKNKTKKSAEDHE